MNNSLLEMIDRVAMSFGNLALLAALPVAAFALIAHAL
jgi:cyanate permease